MWTVTVMALLAVVVLASHVERFSGLRIGESRTVPNGKGVYALKDFKRGQVVERCPVLRQREGEVRGQLNDYVFDLGDGEVGVVWGYGSMYNHSENPHLNYTYDPERKEMDFVAVRPIRKGEEIFSSYGRQWWRDRGMKPL